MDPERPLTTFLEQPDAFKVAISSIYKPLNPVNAEIRLVHIQPAASEIDEIFLTLQIVSLDDIPKFQALSYTWGDLIPGACVNLHSVPYNVTQNQVEALRRFRLVNEVRIMWIDVFCINQDDLDERSSQVGLITRIYSASEQTQIWLGNVTPQCISGLTDEQWSKFDSLIWEGRDRDMLAKVMASREGCDHIQAFLEAENRTNQLIHGASHILMLLAADHHCYDLPFCYLDDKMEVHPRRFWYESMQTLKAILQRPWWTRVWTTQEALLSPIEPCVNLGTHTFLFSDFLGLGRRSPHYALDTVTCCRNWIDLIDCDNGSDELVTLCSRLHILALWGTHHKPGEMYFTDAMALSAQMKTTDLRDFIFGVLGLMKEEQRPLVDYTMSISEVFCQATVASFEVTGWSYNLWKGTIDNRNRTPGLPSWCVDWANQETTSYLGYETYTDIGSVPSTWWQDFRYNLEQGYISLQACHIDNIKRVFERTERPSLLITEENSKIVTDWVLQLETAGVVPNARLDFEDNTDFSKEFFRTVFRDITVEDRQHGVGYRRLRESDWKDIQEWWEITSNILSILEDDPEFQLYHDAEPRIEKFLTAFPTSLGNSTMAVTEGGRICLVPLITEPGDCIYHVKECCVPLVLRKVGSSDVAKLTDLPFEDHVLNNPARERKVFRVVKPCYINDFMGTSKFEDIDVEMITLI